MEFADAGGGHLFALGSGGGILEDHALLYIALHLPKIAGVGFGNVNHVESHLVAILLVKLVERGNLPAKRRSSVTAEYQDDRFLLAK